MRVISPFLFYFCAVRSVNVWGVDHLSPRTKGLVFSHRHEVLNAVRHYIYSIKTYSTEYKLHNQIFLRTVSPKKYCNNNIKKRRGQKKIKMQLFSKKIKK